MSDEKIKAYQGPAGGWGALRSVGRALQRQSIPIKGAKTLLSANQPDGFDCPGCAWPDRNHASTFEFCENGAKAVAAEATARRVTAEFFDEHTVTELAAQSDFYLEDQGRLTQPMMYDAATDKYRPVAWDAAFAAIAKHLNTLPDPNQAIFYTSGRTSNEAAFLYQLFVREYGTNNFPDCSNMCHESTGVAMGETIGIGKSTVEYDDFEKADLVIIMGQNPGTNHPRMLTALEDAKRAGASIVAVNPLPEAGLIRYKNPQTVRGVIGRGTGIADQFLQVRLGGDMALLQAVSKRVLDAEAKNPGTVLDHAFLDEHCIGLEELTAHLANLDESEVRKATGLRTSEIDELAARYLAADRVIITWVMGITQHTKAVDSIREIINLLLLRGNIGKPGAGASPIRGHSNVQGDRTMGIWEQMPDTFLDALEVEFGFAPPRAHGVDSIDGIRAMQRGEIKVWLALGGNLVAAISDTDAAARRARYQFAINTIAVDAAARRLCFNHPIEACQPDAPPRCVQINGAIRIGRFNASPRRI